MNIIIFLLIHNLCELERPCTIYAANCYEKWIEIDDNKPRETARLCVEEYGVEK